MVYYTRDVQPDSAYVDVAFNSLVEEINADLGGCEIPFNQVWTLNEINGGASYSELLTDSLYENAERMEEANITGFLHEFDDDETIAIIDDAVQKVFTILDDYIEESMSNECLTLGIVLESMNRKFNPELYDD